MRHVFQDLENLIIAPEGPSLEFKECKGSYSFDKLLQYCSAISNEGGGRIVFGVSDKRPRKVVGTSAFLEPGKTTAHLSEMLHLRIDFCEFSHPAGRVLAFEIPPHPIGVAIQAHGVYYARSGESLVYLSFHGLKRILDEADPDFSATVHPTATIADLDPRSVARFREMWRKQSGNPALDSASPEKLLADAELLQDGKLTHAALILLGSPAALGKYLGLAELIFEYRASEASIPHQLRTEYRSGFLGILDDLWEQINLRNESIQIQDGLFMRNITSLNETVVREAILNAFTHRDYRLFGSIFVRQYPRRLEISSPGGFPIGITADNIIRKQSPRNRRIAEACYRCGLVERSGQGADRMFEQMLRDGKPKPDFSGTDDYEVRLSLIGEIQNPQFVKFLEVASAQLQISFTVEDLLTLDFIQREMPVPADLRTSLTRLYENGILERIGRGRGTRFVLSRRFYSFLGKSGQYTRRRGLDRETHKELLLKHIRDASPEGARLRDMQDVLKDSSTAQIQTLLRELRRDGRIRSEGQTNAGRWFLA